MYGIDYSPLSMSIWYPIWYPLCIYDSIYYLLAAVATTAKSLQSCPTLCDPIDRSPPGSPVPGILQARTLKWVAISSSNAWKWKVKVKSLSRVRLSDPINCSPPGSSVPGIFQARVLEWGAIAFSIWEEDHRSKMSSQKYLLLTWFIAGGFDLDHLAEMCLVSLL